MARTDRDGELTSLSQGDIDRYCALFNAEDPDAERAWSERRAQMFGRRP